MQAAWGATEAQLANEVELKRSLFAQSTLIHVSTEAEAKRLKAIFAESAEKFVSIPFFLNHLKDCATPEQVAHKQKRTPVELLFIGRRGRTKGLDLLLTAVEVSGLANRSDVRLTVVSNFQDGYIAIPTWSNLRHFESCAPGEVLALMRESHILAMPSRFESYGIVFIEAMASGAIPIVPDWEVQREIVDEGNAGFIVSHSPEDIGSVLLKLVASESLRVEYGMAALARFKSCFSPANVAARFGEAFRRCVEMHRGINK
jgi:glycosyltransferase involved in cell wall biosynthesis